MLQRAFGLARQLVGQAGLPEAEVAPDLAKLVFSLARDAMRAGRSLKADNTAEALASQASGAVLALQSLALCA